MTHTSGQKNKKSMKPVANNCHILRPWRWKRYASPKFQLSSCRLRSVLCQKTWMVLRSSRTAALNGAGLVRWHPGTEESGRHGRVREARALCICPACAHRSGNRQVRGHVTSATGRVVVSWQFRKVIFRLHTSLCGDCGKAWPENRVLQVHVQFS
jgi:hypothetical protein